MEFFEDLWQPASVNRYRYIKTYKFYLTLTTVFTGFSAQTDLSEPLTVFFVGATKEVRNVLTQNTYDAFQVLLDDATYGIAIHCCWMLNSMKIKDDNFQMIILDREENKNQMIVGKKFEAKII